MSYVSKSGFESQKEQLEGSIRFEKLNQLKQKLVVEKHKTQAETHKATAEAIKTQAAGELVQQARYILQGAQAKTRIEDLKYQIVANDLDVISKELPIRKAIGQSYLEGLEADLAMTREATEAKRQALGDMKESLNNRLNAA